MEGREDAASGVVLFPSRITEEWISKPSLAQGAVVAAQKFLGMLLSQKGRLRTCDKRKKMLSSFLKV